MVIIAFSSRSERPSPPHALAGAAVNCSAAPSPFQHPQGPYVAAYASSGRPKARCKRRAWLRRWRRRTAASAREAILLPLVAAHRRAARASRWPPRALLCNCYRKEDTQERGAQAARLPQGWGRPLGRRAGNPRNRRARPTRPAVPGPHRRAAPRPGRRGAPPRLGGGGGAGIPPQNPGSWKV